MVGVCWTIGGGAIMATGMDTVHMVQLSSTPYFCPVMAVLHSCYERTHAPAKRELSDDKTASYVLLSFSDQHRLLVVL